MKKLLLLYFNCFILFLTVHSQMSEDRFHPDYATTSLHEDFREVLNRDIWKPTTHTLKGEWGNPYIFIDSTLTIKVDTVKQQLNLSMHKVQEYKSADWDGNPLSADYVGGEIHTLKRFSYGIFECNALFAHEPGSFPAFWLMSFIPCDLTFLNEIDIVECSVRPNRIVLQNHIFFYSSGCGESKGHKFHETRNIDWSVPHTFKCIWDPFKITFWIDNRKLKQVKNRGQIWYPKHDMNVILSQQISSGEVVIPQTSLFNWVRVREFFLAPEVTSPDFMNFNSTDTATLDVDLRADSVSWELTPSDLFTGKTAGFGNTAAISAGKKSGEGKITYSFKMPGGETFEAEKTIIIGR